MNRREAITLSIQLAIIGSVFLFYYQHPIIYIRLITEDNLGEYLTFSFYILSSILFVKCIFSSKNKITIFWFFLFACISFVFGMEEISWGQRIFNFETPYIFKMHNFQNEMTIHNIRVVSPDDFAYLIVSIGYFVYGFILPLLIRTFSFNRIITNVLNLPVPSLYISPMFIATSYFLNFSDISKGEEIGELFMSLSLFLFAINLKYLYANNYRIIKNHRIIIKKDYSSHIYILAAIIISGGLTYIKPDINNFKSRTNAFAGKEFPKKGLYKQAEMVYDYLDRKPELKLEDYYVDKGGFLLKVNKKNEANKLFNTGLQIDIKRLEQNTSDPTIMTRIAKIYNLMGKMDIRRKYINDALNAYENIISTSTSERKKERAHMARAELYESIGELNESINEYFKAARVSAINSSLQPDIKYAIRHLLHRCQSDNKYTKKNLSWQEIQEIANQLNSNGNETTWCIKHK
jgi:tetratricopeptide (TPR) repeat protein